MKEKLVSKHIRISEPIIKLFEWEANLYGYKLTEWLRMILTDRGFDLSIKFNAEKDSVKKQSRVW